MMQNEKLTILKMLENGQITSSEAANLIKAIDNPSAVPSSPAPLTPGLTTPLPTTAPVMPHNVPNTQTHTYAPPPSGVHHHTPPHSAAPSNNGRPASKPVAAGTTPTFEDLAKKFDSFAKDMAPKVQKFTEDFADKVIQAADKLGSTIATHTASPPPTAQGFGSTPMKTTPAMMGGVQKNIELYVDAGYSELSIQGLNADIKVKGYNGDKITAQLTYKAKRANADIELMKLGNKYFLRYEPDDFHSVGIDAYIPERAFGVISIDGINAQIDASSLVSDHLRVHNANGSVTASALSANHLSIENSGNKLVVNNCTAQNAKIENINGPMEVFETDVANLSISNNNGTVSLIVSNFARYADYLWSVESGNAKVAINLPTYPDLGYHIKAAAAMGEIRLALTGLQYLLHEPSLVEAKSVHFDSAARRVRLNVETSNAPLVIN